MKTAYLADRGVVKVEGDEARHFLHNLVTSDIESLSPNQARWFGLLTPQGKILFDGLAIAMPAEHGGGFLLDVARDQAEALTKRLNFYKLRAKVIVEDLSDTLGVGVAWNGEATPAHMGIAFTDPRLPELGTRIIAEKRHLAAFGEAADWHMLRIHLGVPEGGKDFAWNDAFPHEVLMDQLHGVAFDKGCYVGQEVVSRMHHRGTARTRIIPVTFEGRAISTGDEVLAGEKTAGTIGSVAEGVALAMLRLDRIGDAIGSGKSITVNGTELKLIKPDFIRFLFPHEQTP